MRGRACYNCGSTEQQPYAEENGYALVKCATCGLLFVADPPKPTQISDAVREGTHVGVHELKVTGRFHPEFVPRHKAKLEELFGDDLDAKRSWLDVGCGHGEFIQALSESASGITVRGMEPNVHKVASARSHGLDVETFALETHAGRYDVVSLLDVYSHLPDPPALLTTLRGLLNPGGELLLQTGDAADLPVEDQFRPFGLPDHLSFASERIVMSILTRLGFTIVTVRKYSYLGLDARSIAKEVVKLFLPKYTSKLGAYGRWKKFSQSNMYIRARLGT
ncbi:MAG: class I SAM-dependent methyltransferase [Gemmatimonadaceae bacterium]